MRYGRELVPGVIFGLACTLGLAGAFVGLDRSSFTVDELFTAWIIDPRGGAGAAIARMLTDVHPPVYYAAIYLFSQLGGHSDIALRLFSALCACAAVLVFVFSNRSVFSWPARLFAGALATSSSFWLYNSQNARDYALSLLIGCLILAAALSILQIRDDPPKVRKRLLFQLYPLLLIGAFVHFYLLFECLAVLAVLFLFVRANRGLTVGLAFSLLVLAFAYLKLVIARFTQYSMTDVWIPNDPAWIAGQFHNAFEQTLNRAALAAVAVCLGLALLKGLGPLARPLFQPARPTPRPGLDPALVLCFAVPALVAAAAITSSSLMSPNITDRNLLVCSPFLWGLAARLYDLGTARAKPAPFWLASGLLGLLVLYSTTAVASRAKPRNQEFRAAANWIRQLPACQGQSIPVIDMARPGTARPDYAARVRADEYARYLIGYAKPQAVLRRDFKPEGMPTALRSELQGRLDGQDCPVLAWVSHGLGPEGMAPLSKDILAATGRAGSTALQVKSFAVYSYGLDRGLLPPSSFVLYAARPGQNF